MHTATLLHDDVVDESGLRRGKKTARMLWGNQASVLVGDFLLGQAFRMMVDVGSLPALRILSNAAAVIAEGEVMQLAAAKNTATTEDEYLAVINAKTAALFSAAAEVGAVIAGGRPRSRRRCAPTARISASPSSSSTTRSTTAARSAKLGKSVGDDFREGKITLPVILSFRRGTRRSASSGGARSTDGDIRTATSSTPSSSCAQALEATPSSAPATTAPSRAMRWPSSLPTGFDVSRVT
jgi:octaprenyl-diphosphate synthase